MNALVGGVIIGIAVSVMLLFNGRVTGISGIIGGAFSPKKGDIGWRWLFVAGLVSGGFAIKAWMPSAFEQTTSAQLSDYLIAGVLVGFGTLLGNGCTSGHGVCGLSRLSKRSLIATITFIVFGIISTAVFKWLRGGL